MNTKLGDKEIRLMRFSDKNKNLKDVEYLYYNGNKVWDCVNEDTTIVYSLVSGVSDKYSDAHFSDASNFGAGSLLCQKYSNIRKQAYAQYDSSVTKIGINTFYPDASLSKIRIPQSVTKIESNAFNGCENLNEVSFAGTSELKEIGNDAFRYCTSITELEFPSGIETVGAAFRNCTALTDVILPITVNSVDDYAFEGCNSLYTATDIMFSSSIGLPNNTRCVVRAIDKSKKTYYWGLDSRFILHHAYKDCSLMENVTLTYAIKYVGVGAFENCTSLNSVTLSDAMEKISADTFKNCSSLSSITIPGSIKEIASSAFESCSSLSTLTFAEDSSCTKIGYKAFYGNTSLNKIYNGSDSSSALPSSLTSLQMYSFYGCINLFLDGEFPSGITSIPDYAFGYCQHLTDFTIPSTVLEIGEYAFTSAFDTGYTVCIAGNTISIKNNAFKNAGMETIKFFSNNPSNVTFEGGSVFYGFEGNILVKKGTKTLYGTKFSDAGYTGSVGEFE